VLSNANGFFACTNSIVHMAPALTADANAAMRSEYRHAQQRRGKFWNLMRIAPLMTTQTA